MPPSCFFGLCEKSKIPGAAMAGLMPANVKTLGCTEGGRQKILHSMCNWMILDDFLTEDDDFHAFMITVSGWQRVNMFGRKHHFFVTWFCKSLSSYRSNENHLTIEAWPKPTSSKILKDTSPLDGCG